ncbi:glycosyltransferase family 2 protein [Candidatus Aquiluna sp. UB-MaderosW2red]|uniref:glycosyltransferase family 2 protein n=1 Tax=Candidatus Aquiluna sp. UB-MaderosW2red TaxID=1855377 RepID=UPI000875C0B2|nr:glycosyltransferase [Candidatus Aquiluna sp. UB-MaderosW2red]SCX14888.1 Glycosyltransferase, catalytic subunit of cellulose synthase and poly-beta-1,6-N-acetylglucosamine synthase [Candidatus Aquiluna sp. UB-MaderosW2red]
MRNNEGLIRGTVGILFFTVTLFGLAIFLDLQIAPNFTDLSLTNTWNGITYSNQIPVIFVIWIAVAVALFAAGSFALIEKRSSNNSRRSLLPSTLPLSPRVQMARTRGVFDGEITVTVLIPAHNEAGMLGQTIPALQRQGRAPERIIVVADNCTDKTIEVAEGLGVEIFETQNNQSQKGGALNQVLKTLLPGLGNNDIVMIVDADTTLDAGFIEAAVLRFTADRGLMAVGGIFKGYAGGGLLGVLQRNEYDRYERKINRRRGQVFVLTGTSTMFRSIALKTVAENRGVLIGGFQGDVFDTVSLTEDNELTLALKTLGALMESPKNCVVHTELMPSWRYLWKQRMRWQRGAIENIGSYGMTPATFRYWGQQLGIGYGVIALSSFVALQGIVFLSLDYWVWYPFWLGVGAIFLYERVKTVWHSGWRARLLAATMIPELIYEFFLQAVFLNSMLDIILKRDANWGHVVHEHAGTQERQAGRHARTAGANSKGAEL